MKTFNGTFLAARAANLTATLIYRVNDAEWTIYEPGDPLPPTPPAPPPIVWPQFIQVTEGGTFTIQADPFTPIGMAVLQSAVPITSMTLVWPSLSTHPLDTERNAQFEFQAGSVTHQVSGGGSTMGMPTKFQKGDSCLGQIIIPSGGSGGTRVWQKIIGV